MPTVTLKPDQQIYENGSTIGAYPVTNWPLTHETPSGLPRGSATATGTVTAGAVSMALPYGSYWITKTSGGTYRYTNVIVAIPELNVPPLPNPLPATPYTLTLTVADNGSGMTVSGWS